MAARRRIGGRLWPEKIGRGMALALICLLLAPPVTWAGEQNDEDAPVGWPLKRADGARVISETPPRDTATPLPRRSAVTDNALAAWLNEASEPGAGRTPGTSNVPGASQTLGTSKTVGALPASAVEAIVLPTVVAGATTPGEIASPEIAPLKRIIPPLRHDLIVYAPGDFSISVGTAERLSQIAMRLRNTRDRISIVAHSATGHATGPASGRTGWAGDAQISTHEAVKLSFKRAMLVRLYLIEEGVSPEQIDLEALPEADDDGPVDRVEISPTSRAARR